MIRSLASCLLLVLCGLVVVAPLAGCGGGTKKKKKGSMTIAERLKRAEADSTPGGPARELAKVARLQLTSGDKEGAKATLKKALDSIPATADATIFAPRLVDIAAASAAAADKAAARKAIDRAVAMADGIGDAVTRAELLAKVGAVYGAKEGGLGDAGKARDALAKAADLVMSDDVAERFRPQALAAVALGYANANLAGEAKAVIEKLETMATSLEELRPKAEALAAAANVHAKSGDKEKAASLLAEAAKAAKDIDGAANKTYALIAVANAMKAAGDRKGAAGLAAEAEKTASKISDPEQQKEAMQEVRTLEAAVKD